MSMKDRRVSFSPDVNDNKPMIDFLRHSTFLRATGNGRKWVTGSWSHRVQNDTELLSPVQFLRGLKTKVAKAICIVSKRRASGKGSASTLTRSRSVSDPIESHRAEALEDCIEFLNSSSSLKRTSSVSSTSSRNNIYVEY